MPDGEDLAYMRDQGFRYHFMAEVDRFGWDHVLERALAEAKEGGAEYLYISLDVDVFDPSHAPGNGSPEPGGLTPREVFPLVRRLCAKTNVIGMEIVEFNPLVDPTHQSAVLETMARADPWFAVERPRRSCDPKKGTSRRRCGFGIWSRGTTLKTAHSATATKLGASSSP